MGKGNFTEIAKYKNQVIYLDLFGSGEYMKEGLFQEKVCNANLDDFYYSYV